MKTIITSIALLSLALVATTSNAQGFRLVASPQRPGCTAEPTTRRPQSLPTRLPLQASGRRLPSGRGFVPVSLPQPQPSGRRSPLGGVVQPVSLPKPKVQQPQRTLFSFIAGTWFETLGDVEIKHELSTNGIHRITNLTNGGVQVHQAASEGRVITLLNGRYFVSASGNDLRLSNSTETRTWSKNRIGTAFTATPSSHATTRHTDTRYEPRREIRSPTNGHHEPAASTARDLV